MAFEWEYERRRGGFIYYRLKEQTPRLSLSLRRPSWEMLPHEMKLALAHKAGIELNDYSLWGTFEPEKKDDAWVIRVGIQRIWLNPENWNWSYDDLLRNRDLAACSCPGWKCNRNILQKISSKTLSAADFPAKARRNLAKLVGLDEKEFPFWAQEIKGEILADTLRVTVSVPNVWICADMLRGGPILNNFISIGGSLGQIPSFLLTNKKVVKCKTSKELDAAIREYQGKLWGFVLFAHGGPEGSISSSWGKYSMDNYSQLKLMAAVKCNRYKLASVYLMQCYSGFKGTAQLQNNYILIPSPNTLLSPETLAAFKSSSRQFGESVKSEDVRVWLTQLLQMHLGGEEIKGTLKVGRIIVQDRGRGKFDWSVEFTFDWDRQWRALAVKCFMYQGTNFFMIDL